MVITSPPMGPSVGFRPLTGIDGSLTAIAAMAVVATLSFRPLTGIDGSLTQRRGILSICSTGSFRPLTGIDGSLTRRNDRVPGLGRVVSDPLRGLMVL